MDDAKVIAKSEREVNGLVSTVPILCNNIGMEFEIRKCGVLEGKQCHLKEQRYLLVKGLRKLRIIDISF